METGGRRSNASVPGEGRGVSAFLDFFAGGGPIDPMTSLIKVKGNQQQAVENTKIQTYISESFEATAAALRFLGDTFPCGFGAVEEDIGTVALMEKKKKKQSKTYQRKSKR